MTGAAAALAHAVEQMAARTLRQRFTNHHLQQGQQHMTTIAAPADVDPNLDDGEAFALYGNNRGIARDRDAMEVTDQYALDHRANLVVAVQGIVDKLDTEVSFAGVHSNLDDHLPWAKSRAIYLFTNPDRSGWWVISEEAWVDLHLMEPRPIQFWSVNHPAGDGPLREVREQPIVATDADGQVLLVVSPLRYGKGVTDAIAAATPDDPGDPSPYGLDPNHPEIEPIFHPVRRKGGIVNFGPTPILDPDGTPVEFLTYNGNLYTDPVWSLTHSGPGYFYRWAGPVVDTYTNRRPTFMEHRPDMPHNPDQVEALLGHEWILGAVELARYARCDEERGLAAGGFVDGILGAPPMLGFTLADIPGSEAYLNGYNVGEDLRRVAVVQNDDLSFKVLTPDEIAERFAVFKVGTAPETVAEWRENLAKNAAEKAATAAEHGIEAAE